MPLHQVVTRKDSGRAGGKSRSVRLAGKKARCAAAAAAAAASAAERKRVAADDKVCARITQPRRVTRIQQSNANKAARASKKAAKKAGKEAAEKVKRAKRKNEDAGRVVKAAEVAERVAKAAEEAERVAMAAVENAAEEAEALRQQQDKDKYDALIKEHYIGKRSPCKHGCGAQVWPGEDNLCCKGGKHILNADCNPPLDDTYLHLITQPYYSQQSRALNGGLAMASQGIYPSRALGGVGWHEQAYGHLALFGKTYLTQRSMGYNNAFDNYLLPENLLLDGARHDVGVSYANNLVQTRRYLEEHHPLAVHLRAVADVPGTVVDANPYMQGTIYKNMETLIKHKTSPKHYKQPS